MNKAINKKLFAGALLFLFQILHSDNQLESLDGHKESPVEAGSFSLAIKAGPAPILYTSRGPILGIDPRVRPVVVDLGRVPRFSDQFKLPYVVGVEVGYSLTPYGEFFGEFVYKHASGRTLKRKLGELDVTQVFSNFTAFEWFGGLRLFSCEPWCEKLWPFIGAKVGIIHHKRIATSFRGSELNGTIGYFSSGSVIAEGLQAGFMWECGCGWSFVFTAEVVSADAAEVGQNIKFADTPLIVNIGDIGTVLTFPLSFALRYDF